MKKIYMMPAVEVADCETSDSLLNAVSSDYGIEYGGADDAGDPASIANELDLWF